MKTAAEVANYTKARLHRELVILLRARGSTHKMKSEGELLPVQDNATSKVSGAKILLERSRNIAIDIR